MNNNVEHDKSELHGMRLFRRFCFADWFFSLSLSPTQRPAFEHEILHVFFCVSFFSQFNSSHFLFDFPLIFSLLIRRCVFLHSRIMMITFAWADIIARSSLQMDNDADIVNQYARALLTAHESNTNTNAKLPRNKLVAWLSEDEILPRLLTLSRYFSLSRFSLFF